MHAQLQQQLLLRGRLDEADVGLAPQLVEEVFNIVRDLNIGMTWVSYPGRTNSTATAAEVDFAVAGNR